MENLTGKKSKDNNIGEPAIGRPTRPTFFITRKVIAGSPSLYIGG